LAFLFALNSVTSDLPSDADLPTFAFSSAQIGISAIAALVATTALTYRLNR